MRDVLSKHETPVLPGWNVLPRGTESRRATSAPSSSTPSGFPDDQQRETPVLAHSAWAGWHYEIPANEAGAGM